MKKPSLDKIIENNSNKTGHIRKPGITTMPNKKQTMPFVSEEGYKQGLPPAGSHYRIPSNTLYNPTPYRIKATPNVGPSKWLEPYTNENVQFPGASYVDEQHLQIGGGIYLSDKAKATQFGQYKAGGATSPQTCYDPKTGKEVPCKPGAHKTMIFTEHPRLQGLRKNNLKEMQDYIKNGEFTQEAEDLKNYLIKNQPGEDIDIYPTYTGPDDDRVISTFKNGQLTPLNEVLRQSTPNTRLAFMAHHGDNLFGQPYSQLGKKLQSTTYDNCYLGSCFSGDIAASDEFKGLSNFHYRPNYSKGYSEVSDPGKKLGLKWLGVNPNKNSQTGEAGINTAFYGTTTNDYSGDNSYFTDNPKQGIEYGINNPTNQPHIGKGNTLYFGDMYNDNPVKYNTLDNWNLNRQPVRGYHYANDRIFKMGGGMFPPYDSFAPPRMNNGGDISIPDLEEDNWLNKYDVGGFTVTDETTKPQTKCKDGYGCHNDSKTPEGKGIKKVGSRLGLDTEGGTENYVPLSNAPTTWEELLTYNETNPKDKAFKNQLKTLQTQFPGLTQQQMLAAGADSARIRQRMGNLPRYDQPTEQTFDKAYHMFYRPLMNQQTPVTIPQILQFQSQQPGGLQGFESTVRGNYGRPKAQNGQQVGNPDKPYSKNNSQGYVSMKNNQDWFNSHANWTNTGNPEWDAKVRQQVMTGRFGVDPNSGALIKLPQSEWTNVSDENKRLATDKRQWTPAQKQQSWERQVKPYIQQGTKDLITNPVMMAPGASHVDEYPMMQKGGWLEQYQDGNQVTYTVKKGDTLGQIGKQFGMTPQQIADANNISNIDFIRTNQKLNIPGATIPQQPAVGPTDVPIAPVQFQNTLPSFVQTQPTVQGNYIASPDTSINIKNNPEIYSELDPEISSIISNYTTPSTLDNEEDIKKREKARKIVEIARQHIAMGKKGYFEVPPDVAAASLREGKEPAGCVGGACKIAQEAGAMPKIFWSNTAFTKAAPELGFPNKGYGLRGIQNLEPGDFLTHQTELGGYDEKGNPKYIPRHTQIFLGINPQTKEYEFFDNYHKRLMSYSEADIKDKLKQTKNPYDYGSVIYKMNPFHPTTNSYTDETVQQAADKELFVKEQMKNPSKYKYSIRQDAKDYNNSTKGIMNTFVNYANDDKNITDLVSKLKVGKDEIHDSLLNVFGELGQENNWSNSGKGLKSKAENVAEKVLTFFGGAKRYSVGPGQNKFSTIPEDLREQFGIKSPKDLYDINKVIPLMVAEDIRNKQVLRRWGQQNVLSHKLIGHTDKENPLRADHLKGGVGRWSPYLRNEFGLISTGKRVINNNDLIPWNGEDVTWDNFYKPGAGKLVSNYDMNAGMFMNPRTLAEGSYPDKVFHKTDDNLQRTLITPNTETLPDTLPTQYVFSKAKKKKEFGGQNNWLNNYR